MTKIAHEEVMIVSGTVEMVPVHMTHPEFKDQLDALLDVGEKRLAIMDENEV